MYRLNNTIRNKIFNYKATVNEIDVNDKSTYGTGLATCQCQNSSFVNNNYGHIATGHLKENKNIWHLMINMFDLLSGSA